ncbi:MAG: hypothetical protein MHM6MM_001100 [Cercozoa sp. M6MM]
MMIYCPDAVPKLCCAGWRRRQKEQQNQAVAMHTMQYTQAMPPGLQHPVTYTYHTSAADGEDMPRQYPQQQQQYSIQANYSAPCNSRMNMGPNPNANINVQPNNVNGEPPAPAVRRSGGTSHHFGDMLVQF